MWCPRSVGNIQVDFRIHYNLAYRRLFCKYFRVHEAGSPSFTVMAAILFYCGL